MGVLRFVHPTVFVQRLRLTRSNHPAPRHDKMFGIGLPEFILIAIAALIIIGPDRMPEMAKAVAKAYVQLRKAGDDLTKTVREIEPGPLLNDRQSYASKGKDAPKPAEPAPSVEPHLAVKGEGGENGGTKGTA